MNAHAFLVALTIVLGVAAVTTVVFQRLRQPVVLGYILAGFLIGPNVNLPLFADRQIVQTLSELGVILLMFSLGLEFSLSKLAKLGPSATFLAILQSSLMVWLGFVVGQLFGWTTLESLFTGAIIAISSTTIIAKAFDEQGVRGPLRDLVVGVLIVEDLIAVLLMTGLTAVASGAGLSAGDIAKTTGKLALFLGGLVCLGLLLVPRAVRAIHRLNRPETTVVASIGFCFATSLLAHELGYSVALGAFIAGSLIAESGEAKPIEHLIEPVRDTFAAIFFVSVGILIDPKVLLQYWPAIAVLTTVVIVGKIVGVFLGGFLTGNGVRTSVKAGLSLAQIGEFSFIIAALGLSLKATGEFLYPVAVAVSVITTLSTPWLIKFADPVARFVDRKLPRPIQTFVNLYGSWLEGNTSQANGGRSVVIRRLVRLLALDVALLVGLTIGTALGMARLTAFLEHHLEVTPLLARGLVVIGALLLSAPLVAGVSRLSRQLGLALALVALPSAADGDGDSAAAPRRVLVFSLQLAVVLLAGVVFLALTQPFLGGIYAPVFVATLLLGLAVRFWKGANELQGRARAGAQVVLDALFHQARTGGATAPDPNAEASTPALPAYGLLSGLGEPSPLALAPTSQAIGQSLGQLNLRGLTGTTVLAIQRGSEALLIPVATDILQEGDVLALAGTRDAISAARRLLEPLESS